MTVDINQLATKQDVLEVLRLASLQGIIVGFVYGIIIGFLKWGKKK